MAGTDACPKISEIFPLKTKQVAVEINNIKTELLCTQYQEQIFCIVTQYQKIGNLVSIKQDNIVDETGSTKPMYSTSVLMGKDKMIGELDVDGENGDIVLKARIVRCVDGLDLTVYKKAVQCQRMYFEKRKS